MRWNVQAIALAAIGLVPAGIAQSAASPLEPGNLFAMADSNADGAITRAEFLAARAKMFPTLDQNADSYLSQGEFRHSLPAGPARSFAGRQFGKFDANDDERLSAAEYSAAPTPLFDRADANKDDQLTASEIASAQPQAGG
jgi:Ca2+-binding EF-hand superfamily protein